MKLKDAPTVHIVAIIDRSGSMFNIHDDSIGGFNSFLKEQKSLEGDARISVVLFDDTYKVLYDDLDIQEARALDKTTYTLGGSTAMNDAIGKSLSKLLAKNPEKAVVCILTDGQENASREYTTPQIKQMIEKAQGKGWPVVFLAANQDAFATGAQYGINKQFTNNFAATAKGTAEAYRGLTASVSNYRGG